MREDDKENGCAYAAAFLTGADPLKSYPVMVGETVSPKALAMPSRIRQRIR